MKDDNVTMYDAFMWKWSSFFLCDDDALFITSCNDDEI